MGVYLHGCKTIKTLETPEEGLSNFFEKASFQLYRGSPHDQMGPDLAGLQTRPRHLLRKPQRLELPEISSSQVQSSQNAHLICYAFPVNM